MDDFGHYRLWATEISFGLYRHEHHFILPDDQRELLQDVSLAIRATGNANPNGVTTGPDDVRLYVDGTDVTPAYVKVLADDLNSPGYADRAAEQYEKATQAWIELAEALGPAYSGDLAKDKARRAELIAIKPVGSLLDRLGNVADTGWGGYLHIFHYLYGEVDAPWVSLREVGNHAGVDLLNARRLTVSAGPCRLFTPGWTPTRAMGAVRLQAELRYANPLLPRIEAIEKRLDELETDLIEVLEEILEQVKEQGAIQKSIRQTQASLDAAQTDVDRARAEIASHEQQIASLGSTARDIRDAVNKL